MQPHIVQNRETYDVLRDEIGVKKLKRVHQDKEHFYLDFGEIICTAGCKTATLQMKFFCGLNMFIQSINAIHGVGLVSKKKN